MDREESSNVSEVLDAVKGLLPIMAMVVSVLTAYFTLQSQVNELRTKLDIYTVQIRDSVLEVKQDLKELKQDLKEESDERTTSRKGR